MWWWQQGTFLQKLERKIMSKFTDLKAALDGIAGDLAPIKSGIDSLNANLEALKNSTNISAEDSALLDASLSEAQDLKGKFDALASVFAKNDSPVPVTPDPAPAPVEPPAAAPAEQAVPTEETKPAE